MSMKNPLTQPGIETATFRFVAQHLNHCATAVRSGGESLKERDHSEDPGVDVMRGHGLDWAGPG